MWMDERAGSWIKHNFLKQINKYPINANAIMLLMVQDLNYILKHPSHMTWPINSNAWNFIYLKRLEKELKLLFLLVTYKSHWIRVSNYCRDPRLLHIPVWDKTRPVYVSYLSRISNKSEIKFSKKHNRTTTPYLRRH